MHPETRVERRRGRYGTEGTRQGRPGRRGGRYPSSELCPVVPVSSKDGGFDTVRTGM